MGQFLAFLVVFSITKVCLGNRDNIALRKTATQSSRFYWGYSGRVTDYSHGSLAVDGDTSTTPPRQCWQSNPEDRPWWSVDLGQDYTLGAFRIFIRSDQDCTDVVHCKDRLRGFEIYVSNLDSPPTSASGFGESCHHSTLTELPDIIEVGCSSQTTGRHVTITLPSGDSKTLSLCEVEIYEFVPSSISPSTEFLDDSLSTLDSQLDSMAPSISPSAEIHGETATGWYSATQMLHALETPEEFTTHEMSSQHDEISTSVLGSSPINGPSIESSSQQSEEEETGQCECTCAEDSDRPFSDEFMDSILEGLTIDTSKVSSVRRRYESATDERPSAKALGCLGAIFLGVFFGCVLLLDFKTLLSHVIMLIENLQMFFRRKTATAVPEAVRASRDLF